MDLLILNKSVFLSEYMALLLGSDPVNAFDAWKRFFRAARDGRDFQTCYQLLQEVKRSPFSSAIVAEIKYQEGLLQYTLDNWQAAEKCFSESLKFLEANGDKRLISKAITHIGDALKKQGRWNEALSFFKQALEIDRALGDSDAETIDLQDIASIYEEQGRFSEALDLYRKCVQILGDSTDRDRGAKLISNAASCMSMMGRMDDAIPLLELALKLRTDPQSVGYATTLTTLGSVLRRQGKLEEADKAFTQALSIISDLKDFYLKSVLVNHFGTLQYEKGQFEEAKQNYQTALEMKQQLGDLKGVGVVLNNLGMLFEKMSLLDDAVAALNKSLKIRQQLGDVRGIAVNSNNLGNVYFGLGQHQIALEKYLESIQLCRESGVLDVQIISLKRIAILYRTMGDIENAAAAEVEVLRLENRAEDK